MPEGKSGQHQMGMLGGPKCLTRAAPDGVDSAAKEGAERVQRVAAHPGAATLWNCRGVAMAGATPAVRVPIWEWM